MVRMADVQSRQEGEINLTGAAGKYSPAASLFSKIAQSSKAKRFCRAQANAAQDPGLAKSSAGPRLQVFCGKHIYRVARRDENTLGLADNVPALR